LRHSVVHVSTLPQMLSYTIAKLQNSTQLMSMKVMPLASRQM